MLFFYDKLGYLYRRQCELYAEMKRRGYNPTFNPESLYKEHGHKHWLWNEWEPTAQAIAINRQRIKERSPWIK